MSDELLIPFPHDEHPDYFTPGFPTWELQQGNAAALMDWFSWQADQVPDLYKGEPFNCQDLDDYQDIVSRFIHYYADKELPTDQGLPYSFPS